MEYATSMLLNDMVHATEVDYGDCTEFFIRCPNPQCGQAVFKVGNAASKRQYFSHYPGHGKDDCDLRAEQIARERLMTTTVMPQGQELAGFLRRFEEVTLNYAIVDEAERKAAAQAIDRMRRRGTVRLFINAYRAAMRRVIFEGGLTSAGEQRPSIIETHRLEDCREVFEFLLADNSYAALSFAVCVGALAINADFIKGNDPLTFHSSVNPDDFAAAFKFFVHATDREFNKAMKLDVPRMHASNVMIYAVVRAAAFFVLAVRHSVPVAANSNKNLACEAA